MRQYIAFLRGINRGLTLKMADLRKLFERLGFTNIKTVLATGNVIFQASQSNRRDIASQIERAIASAYHYETVAILYTKDKLGELVEANPFHAIAGPQRVARRLVLPKEDLARCRSIHPVTYPKRDTKS